jgi:soluble lytic murein transglycosylase
VTPPLSANTPTLLPENRVNTRRALARFSLPAGVLSTVALLLCLALTLVFTFDLSAQTKRKKKKPVHPKSPACATGCKPDTSSPTLDSATPDDAAAQKELANLSRDLHVGVNGAYEKLAGFANSHASSVWGQRAALALGYSDFSKARFPQALTWLEKAKSDELLREYGAYWTAQTEISLHRQADALKGLTAILNEYPNTVMKEQAVESYATAALDVGRSQNALDMLATYAATNSKPSLLLVRARAEENARKLVLAAKDYQAIFYKYPLADEANGAGISLSKLSRELHSEFPYATTELQEQRAQAFYDGHKWKEARIEYDKLIAMLKDPANPTRQRALVRSAESRQHPKAAPSLLANIKALSDPDAEAERLYALSQAYRSEKNETAMLTNIELVVEKFPQSRWTEEALMAGGNYYWVQLDRAKASHYYERVLDSFPGGKNAYNAEWRIAWVAYLERQPYADDKITVFLRKYPVSGGAVNALYWLGRNAERGGNPAHARAYFRKAVDRWPNTYFAYAAQAHLDKLGPGEVDSPDFLIQLPGAQPLRPFDEAIAPSVVGHWNRAQALRTIAFDTSAELELKAAYAVTSSPRFLVEAAQVAFDQGHFASGMNYGRLAVPSFDSRKLSEVPMSAWKALYPLPYESQLRREAERNNFDPMFAAGLIRQESTFQADAVSHANAIGLMQILPKEGRRLARERKIRYTKTTLFDPNMNIELGMLYISDLSRSTGAYEYAAAAYNAGEDRLAQWKGERSYEEIAEFVESIPFTETREYVQIVLRNATMYRLLYGDTQKNTISAAVRTQTRTGR